jgi:ornithine cyclodeaminase/alanine dehydrogenase-like protein (mu-crystallin family)
MVLMLSNDDVEQLLTMPNTLAVLEDLYRDLGSGSAVYRARTDLHTPTSTEVGPDIPAAHYLKSMDGAVPRLQAAAIRLTSDVVAFPLVNGLRRREKLPAAPGNRWLGLVLLFSTANGELLAILQDGLIQRTRVGATNGIAARYLAPEGIRRVGLIGAGWQAGTQLMALTAVRPIRAIKVYSPTRERAESFAEEMTDTLQIEVRRVTSAEEAVRDVDIAVTSTNSRVPFFPAEWFRPGMHLSCMQRDEATDACFKLADVVVFHTRAREQNYTSRDFAAVEERYGFEIRDHQYPRDLDWNAYPDLGELVSGQVAGRSSPSQRTLFLNSIGVGAQFAAVGHYVYRRARERGLGHEIPIDWFVESVHP